MDSRGRRQGRSGGDVRLLDVRPVQDSQRMCTHAARAQARIGVRAMEHHQYVRPTTAGFVSYFVR